MECQNGIIWFLKVFKIVKNNVQELKECVIEVQRAVYKESK